jgi:hypothetical protein
VILRYFLPLLVFILVLIQYQCSIPEVDDIDPPVVSIIYPYAGSVISGNTNFLVESTDNDKVERVWIYIDDQVKASQNGGAATFEIDVSPSADDQVHLIQAAAQDKSGNKGFSPQVFVTISDSPDLVPPTVSIVNPLTGQQVQDTVKVLASANDDRIVQNIAFFVNGDSVFNDNVYPYEYDWVTTNLADSTSHSIFAKAFDQSGNWALSTPVTVTVFPRGDRTPPVLALLYPPAGSAIQGIVNVVVDALDDVEVDSVQFFVDGVLEITDITEPWDFPWNTAPFDSGTVHTLYMKGFDTSGNIGTAGPFSFTKD